MKVLGQMKAAALAALWGSAYGLSEDWFDDAMKQGFPHVQSVMSIVLKKPDPCEVAVASMENQQKTEKNDLFEQLFESVFPNRACRGQIMFSRAEEEECMAIQNSPEIEEMIAKGIETPTLVCGWRKFWTDVKSNNGAHFFDTCELCERTVQMIENTFEKQELALEIVQEALKVLCQYLPEGSQCKVLVDRFDDIVKWLKEGLSPHNICLKVSMCKKLALPHHPASDSIALRGAQSDELCSICRDNANAMNSLVGLPHGLELYKGGMDSVCASAAETKTCRFMSTHFHKIASHLKRGDDVSTTCRAVRACASTEVATIQKPTFLGCVYCEFVGQVITSALHQGGNETLPLVKMDVEAMCKNMPASAQCSVMDDKFYELADLMAKGKEPEVGCEAVGMCAHVSSKQTPETQVANILSVLDKLVASLDVSYDVNHYVGCSTCEHTAYAIERVEKEHKSSLPMLKKAIRNLCHFLPPCAECRKIYSRFDELVALIEKGEHAKPACTELGFCKPENSLATPYLLELESQVKKLMDGKKIGAKGDVIGCIFCEYTGEMINQVSKYSKDVVPLLKIGLETLCTRLPQEAKCTEVVESFDVIAELIEAGKTSHEACENVKLCEASAMALVAPVTKSKALTPSTAIITKVLKKMQPSLLAGKSDSITCTMCEATAESIATILKYNKELIPVFKIGLEVLCDRFQTPQCVNVMPEFDHLVDLVESGKDFIAACEAAKLCESTSTALIATHPSTKALVANSESSKALAVSTDIVKKALKAIQPTLRATKSDEITCSMCEATAESIAAILKYNKELIPVFKIGMEVLCDRFQTPQCINVMPEFDHLVELVESGKNFLEACESAKLCDSDVVPFYETNQVAVQKVDDIEAQIRSWMTRKPTESNDVISCLFCEYTGLVIDQVAHYDKDIVPFLKTGIQTLCGQLPVKEQCEEVVAKFDALAELIESGSASLDACSKVHLCEIRQQPALPSSLNGYVSSQVAIFEAKLTTLAKSASENDILSCLLCEDTAQLIKTVSKYDKDAVPLLKTGIQALCIQVPQLQAQCNSIVTKFDSLASLIEKGEDPSVACAKVHLCEAATNAATSKLESQVAELLAHPEEVSSEEGCLFCQYASESISTVIKFDKGQLPIVREAIGAMCSVLPPSVHCDDVNEHFEELAKSLEHGASALDACHRIALCKSPKKSAVTSPVVEDAAMKIQVVIDDLVANQ